MRVSSQQSEKLNELYAMYNQNVISYVKYEEMKSIILNK